MRNIPNGLTRPAFTEQIVASVHPGAVTMIHLPWDERRNANRGYAFVRLANSDAMLCFWAHWHNLSWAELESHSKKVSTVQYASQQNEVYYQQRFGM